MKRFAAVALAAALSGCHPRPPFKSLAAECADRADRHGAKVEKAIDKPDSRVIGWTNHYNRTDGHCYMLINFVDDRRDQPQFPRSFVQLHEPIEGRMVAGYTTVSMGQGGRGAYCFIIGTDISMSASPCAEARTFVTDRMTK